MTDNLKGALLMTFAMVGFAIEDALIKLTAPTLGAGAILLVVGALGALFFGRIARRRGAVLLGPVLWSGPVLARNLAEAFASVFFVTALVRAPLSIVTAIIQATPLVVTLGAALVLHEAVGWRRWSAILVGLAGVLIILRPWDADFDANALWAVAGMICLALRDLATRAVPKAVPSTALAAWALAALVPVGGAMMLVQGGVAQVTGGAALGLLGILASGLIAYYAIISAMRLGDVAVVTPFRYTRLLAGLAIAVVVFGERPDAQTFVGAGIVLIAGLYTLWREARQS